MKINGKEYKINTDITWGSYKALQKAQETNDPSGIEKAIKEMLSPKPTQIQFDKFKMSHITGIIEKFAEMESEKESELKKKLSR